jgi:hypothetical protein
VDSKNRRERLFTVGPRGCLERPMETFHESVAGRLSGRDEFHTVWPGREGVVSQTEGAGLRADKVVGYSVSVARAIDSAVLSGPA